MSEQRPSYDVSALHCMLRGEIAAVESYNLAIRTLHHEEFRGELERIRDQHQCSVCTLRRWARDLHEPPAAGSGVWGFFAIAVTGLAALAGDEALLLALRRGERYGEAAYRLGLGDPDLPDDFRHLIGARLLPQCQQHLHRLERMAGNPTAAAF